MSEAETVSLCPQHGVIATGICGRCGRFGCGQCLSVEAVPWCRECLARPEARLASSATAKRALALALLGLHGLVPLLPLAAWLARGELRAIDAGVSPPAGRPLAQGAVAVSVTGLLLWAGVLAWWLRT